MNGYFHIINLSISMSTVSCRLCSGVSPAVRGTYTAVRHRPSRLSYVLCVS